MAKKSQKIQEFQEELNLLSDQVYAMLQHGFFAEKQGPGVAETADLFDGKDLPTAIRHMRTARLALAELQGYAMYGDWNHRTGN